MQQFWHLLINDSDYVTLQVLDEVVGNVVIKNTAYSILVIVERNESVTIQSFAEDLGTVKGVSMENTVDLLAGSDAVCIVGVFDVIELLKLTALFPSQIMTEVGDRVAEVIIDNRHTVDS